MFVNLRLVSIHADLLSFAINSSLDVLICFTNFCVFFLFPAAFSLAEFDIIADGDHYDCFNENNCHDDGDTFTEFPCSLSAVFESVESRKQEKVDGGLSTRADGETTAHTLHPQLILIVLHADILAKPPESARSSPASDGDGRRPPAVATTKRASKKSSNESATNF